MQSRSKLVLIRLASQDTFSIIVEKVKMKTAHAVFILYKVRILEPSPRSGEGGRRQAAG